MLGIAGDRHAPLECAAANGKIAQSAFYKRNHFIAARLRTYETGVLLVMSQQLVGKGGKLEVIILFAHGLRRPAAFRAWSTGADRVNIKLVKHAVLAGVSAFIDVLVFLEA